MRSEMKYSCLVCVLVLLPALCRCQSPFTRSRATYYSAPDGYGTSTGACGFGDYGKEINDGYVTGVSKLFRNGAGCGACYQVRCKKSQCTSEGAIVVVTDYGEGDRTDFILSSRAYAKMAKQDEAKTKQLFAYGTVDVEFRRVPCRYPGRNILLKVHEQSKYPDYLAIVLLYADGTYDISAVEYWEADCKQWVPMRRAYGAVFDTTTPPNGEVKMRFKVSSSNGETWMEPRYPLPAQWEAGAAYDSQIQLD